VKRLRLRGRAEKGEDLGVSVSIRTCGGRPQKRFKEVERRGTVERRKKRVAHGRFLALIYSTWGGKGQRGSFLKQHEEESMGSINRTDLWTKNSEQQDLEMEGCFRA